MLSLTQSTPNPPSPPPLSSRKELFAHHVARGASLAQAARLAGYSPQGARQRGSVLMAESDVRLRVEALRHAWMDERNSRVERAIERLDEIIDMAMELRRPTAALKAMEFQLKLSGVIRDSRAGLYADSPDDDLSKVFFDPREDEDPDFNPEPPPDPAETEACIPTLDDPEDDPEGEADAGTAPAPGHAESVQLITIAASSHPRLFGARPSSARRHTPPPPPAPPPLPPADVAL
jgi:phage terminase small subunit